MGATHQHRQGEDDHPNGRTNPAHSLHMGRLLLEGADDILCRGPAGNLIRMQHLVLTPRVDKA